MKEISIDFAIQSIDSNQEFTVEGVFDNNSISFIDPSKDSNTLTLYQDMIDYEKSGASILHFTFDKNTSTMGTYEVYNHQFEFTVVTTKLVIENQYIEIIYQLLQEEELVNETSLTLSYEFTKED